jgi:cysteinyl-tRNA synthetase
MDCKHDVRVKTRVGDDIITECIVCKQTLMVVPDEAGIEQRRQQAEQKVLDAAAAVIDSVELSTDDKILRAMAAVMANPHVAAQIREIREELITQLMAHGEAHVHRDGAVYVARMVGGELELKAWWTYG